eukprot:scaffold79799_cov20-Tisochrysis_lutea.AAC.1
MGGHLIQTFIQTKGGSGKSSKGTRSRSFCSRAPWRCMLLHVEQCPAVAAGNKEGSSEGRSRVVYEEERSMSRQKISDAAQHLQVFLKQARGAQGRYGPIGHAAIVHALMTYVF